MRTQPIGIISSVLSLAGLMLAQGPTPTGIQTTGAISLLHSESKMAFGSAPATESFTDTGAGGFQSIDYTNYTPPTLPPVTTIGACFVTTLTLPLAQQPPSGIVSTTLDAGPGIN